MVTRWHPSGVLFSLVAAVLSTGRLGATSVGDAGCPQGTYSDPGGRCSWCREGTFQDETGAKQCKECRPGTISKEIAATSVVVCKNCPSGAYATSLSSCDPCPMNTISPAGATSIKECSSLPGYYGQPGTLATSCPARYYCVAGTFVPTPCPPGTTAAACASECAPGVENVVLFDWVFASMWVALFLSGAIWMGAYKMLKTCYHKQPYPRTIQIHIVRSTQQNKREPV
jgi:hypothetical protein